MQNLKLIPLGGIGDVTKNMYIYEYGNDIIIVDCGIGFPDVDMYGIDLVIPDITYLKKRGGKIHAILLTHGHEDHIGALPYILSELKAPVYATTLTAALAENKLREVNIPTRIHTIKDDAILTFGPFTIRTVHVTHSIPDAVNFIIDTPVGTIYHGSDFKFDWTPVYGKMSDVVTITQAGKKGILCLLSDCVRVEKEGYTLSEQAIEQTFETEIRNCSGKFIVTTQSSNISRLQQAINVAVRNGRYVALLGRSIEQAVRVATRHKFLKLPKDHMLYERQIRKFPDKKLALLVAGSQGQIGSALSRIAHDGNKYVRIGTGDKIVFSSDPIPGNENSVYSLIDELTRLGAKIVYTDISEDLHVSGHGSAQDLRLMIALTQPKYLIPIGGTYRHMYRYRFLATEMGYDPKNVLLLENGQVATFDRKRTVAFTGKVEAKNILVDGLGVGDISQVVLRDRQQMASDGVVIVIVSITENGELVGEPDVISRGFIYARKSKLLISNTKQVIKQSLYKHKRRIVDWRFIRETIAKKLEEFFFRETRRRPLVLPVIIEA